MNSLSPKKPPTKRILAKNKKAGLFEIRKRVEAGIVLTGAEVKAVKTRGIQLEEARVRIQNGEAWLIGAVIPFYPFARREEQNPKRIKKLLLRRSQIAQLYSAQKAKLTILPLACYTKRGLVKVVLGVGRPKKKWQRKQELINRAIEKELARTLKNQKIG